MRFLCAVGLAVTAAQSAAACSLSPYLSVRLPGLVSFIGVASADTALAGPGRMKLGSDGARLSIFGQVVRVERLGAGAIALLGRDAQRIVVVPWAYEADCSTVAWDRSARWVAPDTRGVFSGRLRDRADWIDGRPTIDLTVTRDTPYIGVAPRYRLVTRNPTTMMPDPALTPDQALDLTDVLPPILTSERSAATIRASSEPLFQWAREHGDLVTRFPALEILAEARVAVKMALVQSTRSPVAGTYRFAILLSSGDTITLYARSEEFPTTPLWHRNAERARTYSADGLPETYGHSLLIRTARRESDLLTWRVFDEAGLRSEGYLTLLDQPIATSRDSTIWRGSADILRAASQFVQDPQVRARLDSTRNGQSNLLGRKEISVVEGRFVTFPDGRVRYEQRMAATGTLLFAIDGERISTTVLQSH